jgi:hypothetical protein
MPLAELPRHLGCVDRQVSPGEHQPFQEGYVAGWQSVRGADGYPLLIPPSPVFVGSAMYMVGYSRGSRDAEAMTPASASGDHAAPADRSGRCRAVWNNGSDKAIRS